MSHAVSVCGAGPRRLLFLHGWLTGSGMWSEVVARLDGSAYTCAAADAPGYGRGGVLDTDAGDPITRYATAAAGVIDDLGWDDAVVVGHSMGGLVAQEMLVRGQVSVAGVLGVAPVPATGTPMSGDRRASFEAVARTLAGRTEHFEDRVDAPRPVARGLAESSFADVPPDVALRYLDGWTDHDISASLPLVTTPALVLLGERDASITFGRSEPTWRSCFRDVDLRVIPGAGHYLAHEAPTAVVDAIDQLCSRLDRDPGRTHR